MLLRKGQIDWYPQDQTAALQNKEGGLIVINYRFENERYNCIDNQTGKVGDTDQLYEQEEEWRDGPAQINKK